MTTRRDHRQAAIKIQTTTNFHTCLGPGPAIMSLLFSIGHLSKYLMKNLIKWDHRSRLAPLPHYHCCYISRYM